MEDLTVTIPTRRFEDSLTEQDMQSWLRLNAMALGSTNSEFSVKLTTFPDDIMALYIWSGPNSNMQFYRNVFPQFGLQIGWLHEAPPGVTVEAGTDCLAYIREAWRYRAFLALNALIAKKGPTFI
jgi:hypothetical protein